MCRRIPSQIGAGIQAGFALALAIGIIVLIRHWIVQAQYFDALGGAVLGAAVLLWLGKLVRKDFNGYLWIHDHDLPNRLNIGDNITPEDIQRVIVSDTYRVDIHSFRYIELGLQVVGRRDFVSLKQGSRAEEDELVELGRRLATRWGVEYRDLEAVLENKQGDWRLPLIASCFWDDWDDSANEAPAKASPDPSCPRYRSDTKQGEDFAEPR